MPPGLIDVGRCVRHADGVAWVRKAYVKVAGAMRCCLGRGRVVISRAASISDVGLVQHMFEEGEMFLVHAR